MLDKILVPSAHRRVWSMRDACGLFLRIACCVWLAGASYVHALGTGKPLWEYGHQSWQSDSGLPQNTVHSIIQTHDGYLWIGTEAGLVRYDGIDFRVFDSASTPALHSDFISALTEDASGSLWISTPSGLVCERAGAFTAYSTVQGLPSEDVLGAYVTHDGRLFALTSSGVAEFGGGRFAPLPGTKGFVPAGGAGMIAESAHGQLWIAGLQSVLPLDRNSTVGTPIAVPEVGEIQALAVASNGDLWVGGANGLAVLGHGKRMRFTVREGLPADDVTSLLATPGGGLWIGSSKGLVFFSHGTMKAEPGLAGRRVQSLFLDRAATLWVAMSDTVARVTGGTVEFATQRALLTGVLSIFEDREGSMWFGTDTAGLHVLREQPFSTITVDDGLSASLVRALLEDHSGNLWIGTSGGGLDRFAGGKVSWFAGKLPSKVVLALAETGSSLWVGTPEGLARIHDGQTRVFTTADGLADDFVRSLYADRDGSLWIGTRNGLSHLENGTFRSSSRLDGLGSDLIGATLRSRAGALWIGTLGGLSRETGSRFVNIYPHGGTGSDAVTALLEDGDGTLWIGTNGSGLSRLRQGTLTALPLAGLPDTIFGMLEDASGDLWLSSRKGIYRISIASLNAFAEKRAGPPPVAAYGAADGMRISEASGGGHPAAWRAHDGGLWFAMLDGAAVVYPQSVRRNMTPPPTSIEQVIVDDQPAHPGKHSVIMVAPGHGRLTIRYAGLSFVAPQKVHYRYKLLGFDKSWIDAGTRRTAFYTNVPPGSYRFIVLSANNDGVWSTAPASVQFTVEPYFYQTVWFYALVAAALAGIGYLIYRWRVLTVEAQYQAVLAERSRIAREIHDTLAQGYVAVSVQLELAERLLQSSTEAAVRQLQQTKELVRDNLAEARSSIWDLRAQSDAKTLPAEVAVMTRRHSVADGATLRFTVHGTYRPLPRRVEEEVQRIAQEAVANAVAHAQAGVISVTLSYDVQLLELRVEDDGIGLGKSVNWESPRGHFGLQGMRERAARIDSLLNIDSGTGRGTIVTLRVDLQHAAGKDAQ